MQCPSCSNIVPENSRFCPQCGIPLAEGAVDTKQAADRFALLKDYIPPELASKILAAGRKIESERRHVTVMFADVTGFTTLSEKVDPEILSTLLNDCFKGLVSIIHKYEGTIDKFIGDAVMAIFGAPLAHENDPERAARCALEMMEDIRRFNALSRVQMPTEITLHIGLHSGMVIAGNVGSDLRMNYSVVGDTVNLASRLAELAPPGQIYMTGDTFKMVSQIVVVDGPHPTAVKGKAQPVNIYKLRDIKESSARRATPGTNQLFVGRGKELKQIGTHLETALEKKAVRLFIRGEAGVGKSRLKDEIYRMAEQKGLSTVEGLCSSFETTTPYFLWNTLLRNILQIDFDTPELETRNRLHKLWTYLNLQADEPYVAALLSIRYDELLADEEEIRKQKIFAATAAFFKKYVEKYPTIIFLEDLHWIDKFSQELLEFLLSHQVPIPTLVIGLYRDEYLEATRIEPYGEVINLNRLSREDSINLVKLKLDADEIPEDILKVILTRSEGNPFFIQEIVQTLLEKSIINVSNNKVVLLNNDFESVIPGTIQGVIMARIDRIQESIKSVLFSASVIGREFSRPLLEQVVEAKSTDLDTKLGELKTLELILEKEEALEFDYIFKHYLIQEVAYNTILINKRKELHATIATAIEKLYTDRLTDFYEVLAFHYEKAEQWEKAAEYLSRSGHKVKQIFSEAESKDFFERKEAAMQKVYEAASAKWSFWGTIKAITPPLIAMLIPILPIFAYISVLGKTQRPDFTQLIIVGSIASLLCLWYAMALWFLGVIPFLRGRPKLYDLLENQVRVIFQDGSSLALNFEDIGSVRYFDPRINAGRSLWRKMIDPLSRVASNKKLTFRMWLRDVVFNILPPYSFGFGSHKGEIHVRLKEGHRLMRMVIPWFNSPRKSKDISLLPFAPREFFDQFRIAFQTWKKKQNGKPIQSDED
jgi:class 3 adenylate cyclase